MATLRDVSLKAGVSMATVSRVLNGNKRVSSESVELVKAATEALGYDLKMLRQKQRDSGRGYGRKGNGGKKKKTVALLFPDKRALAMQTPLSGRLMHSITNKLADHQYHLIPTLLQDDGGLPALIREREVDGVLVRGATDVTNLVPQMTRLPCVWMLSLSTPPAYGDQVMDDAFGAGKLAAKYFDENGYKEVAVLNDEPGHPCYHPRIRGFVEEAEVRGIVPRVYEGLTMTELVERALGAQKRPEAMFLPLPDIKLVVVYRELVNRGIRPGEDMGWLGCSYDPRGLAAMNPGLANIEIEAESIGKSAVEMLFWRMDNPSEPRRRMSLTPRLCEPGKVMVRTAGDAVTEPGLV